MFFSPFLHPLLAGHPKASGACSPGQGLLFAGEPRNFALSLCFLGGPRTRRAAKPKQKPAVPPARRRLSQLAVPARRRGLKRRRKREIKAGQQREIRPPVVHSIKGKSLERGVLLHRAGSGSLILGPPGAFFSRSRCHQRKPAAFTAFLFLPAKSTSFLGLTWRATSSSASRTEAKKARGTVLPPAAVAGGPKKSRKLARFFRRLRHLEGGEAEAEAHRKRAGAFPDSLCPRE